MKTIMYDSLQEAIDQDAYEYLASHASVYLEALEKEIKNHNVTPEQIRLFVSARVGPDRQGLALRCEQAARHMQRMQG